MSNRRWSCKDDIGGEKNPATDHQGRWALPVFLFCPDPDAGIEEIEEQAVELSAVLRAGRAKVPGQKQELLIFTAQSGDGKFSGTSPFCRCR